MTPPIYPRGGSGPRRHRWCFAWTRYFDRAKVGWSSDLQIFHVLRIVEQIMNYARTLMNAIAGLDQPLGRCIVRPDLGEFQCCDTTEFPRFAGTPAPPPRRVLCF